MLIELRGQIITTRKLDIDSNSNNNGKVAVATATHMHTTRYNCLQTVDSFSFDSQVQQTIGEYVCDHDG